MRKRLDQIADASILQWKGQASYHTLLPPSSKYPIQNRIWSYPSPTRSFTPLKDYVSFYATSGMDKDKVGGEWRCFVDGERVGVQEG